MDSTALTPAEQREYLRLMEKMRNEAVIAPTKAQGRISEAAKRQRDANHDDRAEYSALKDAFDTVDAGEWEQVIDPSKVPISPDGSQLVCKPFPGPFPSRSGGGTRKDVRFVVPSWCPKL